MDEASLEQRSRLSRALNDIDIRIHSNLAPADILQSALEGFVEALAADAGDIKLIDGDEWVVGYQTGFGDDATGLRLPRDQAPVAERVAADRAPVLVPDYLQQPDLPYVGFPRTYRLRSTMAVPLVVRGEVIGSLFAWMKDRPRDYTAEEVAFARRMAASVALAMENARLLDAEKTARRLAERTKRALRNELEVTRTLLRVSDELASTTDPDELLERLSRVVLDATGLSRVFINLVDTRAQILLPKVATGGLVAPRGTEIPFCELSETSRTAIAEKRVRVLDYERDGISERDRRIAESNNCRVTLFVPLVHQSEIVGVIALDEPGERHDFSPKQIRVVESIASQAAIALQNARQFEREHRIAEALQQALLLPPERVESVDVAYLYQAASASARVGGDFYDVFRIDDDRIALIVGDVSGKGIEAAPLTALLRDGIRAYLLEDSDPGSCLNRLNSLVHRFTPEAKFATAFIGVLNRVTGELKYCCAAHPPAVVSRGEIAQVLPCRPTALIGAFPLVEFGSETSVLEPGDILVVVTDGVTEARRESELFGEDGLCRAIEDLHGVAVTDMPAKLLAKVTGYADGPLRDDIVILCVARHAE